MSADAKLWGVDFTKTTNRVSPIPTPLFRKKIKKMREAGGVTQAKLARRLKVTQSDLSRFEANGAFVHSVSLVSLSRWARALGCTPSDLLA